MDDPSFIKGFLEGNDVPTVIGIAADPERRVHYANIVVDYADIREEIHRKGYAQTFEEHWNDDYFRRGFEITRKGPEAVYVASKRALAAFELGGGETNVLNAPSFFVDARGVEGPIDEFFEMAKETGVWVFHIRTTLASYLFIVDYPSGDIASKTRLEPPITLVDRSGEGEKHAP